MWRDREREILWLLCFADQHDGGYDLGHALVSEDPTCDELYPKLDPEYPTFGFSTAPWGEYQDEDALEWTRFVAGHGHVLARTRVPDGVEFLPLDASEQELRAAIPEFWDAATADAMPPIADDDSAIATRLAELRPHVAEYELLRALRGQQEFDSRLLSPREREVATLLRQGVANREIAQQLMVSPATVRTAIQRIYWKLGHDMQHKLHR